MKVGKQGLQHYHVDVLLIDLQEIVFADLDVRLHFVHFGIVD